MSTPEDQALERVTATVEELPKKLPESRLKDLRYKPQSGKQLKLGKLGNIYCLPSSVQPNPHYKAKTSFRRRRLRQNRSPYFRAKLGPVDRWWAWGCMCIMDWVSVRNR